LEPLRSSYKSLKSLRFWLSANLPIRHLGNVNVDPK
jgi:hypothetical protein